MKQMRSELRAAGLAYVAAMSVLACASHVQAEGQAVPASFGRTEALSSSSPEPRDALCEAKESDPALQTVAADVARRISAGETPPNTDEINFMLRARGTSYLWPRVWSVSGPEVERTDAESRFAAWTKTQATVGRRRCGGARARGAGGEAFSAIVVDSMGELVGVPAKARLGQWIPFEAHLFVDASDGRVLLLGPRGRPRPVITRQEGRTIRTTFSLDAPGTWLVQVLATTGSGPRPMLETWITLGEPSERAYSEQRAPGEEVATQGNDEAQLFAMVNAARTSEGLGTLTRDRALDALALAQAKRMASTGVVAHDLGSGDLAVRARTANLAAKSLGENLATAANLRLAHRALWRSPSHRETMLSSFSRLGVAVASGPEGRVYVAEVFAL